MKALDEGNFACGIFVDLLITILIKKLDHYGVRGISNKWFGSYLTDRKESVLINGLKDKLKGFNDFKNNQQKCMK